MLTATGLVSGYGRIEVLHGIDLSVREGEFVAVIGANGAGKSTLLKTIAGLLRPQGGTIAFEGQPIGGMRPELLVRKGISLVPEGRMLFGPMSVRQNLEIGAYTVSGGGKRAVIEERLGRVHELFPVLADRSDQAADTLSGGEQQMLAVARALMAAPRLLLLDEPSLGLAPKVIAEIFSALDSLRAEGMTVLLVEQDARLALKHADRGYVVKTGAVAMQGPSARLLADDSIRAIYLGY
jgi:branched-chain amino acid transport system ATP-binding protein